MVNDVEHGNLLPADMIQEPPVAGRKQKGRQTTLTPELARKLYQLWSVNGTSGVLLTDAEICIRAGCTHGQLRGWFQRNVKVAMNPGAEPESLWDIRARARSSLKANFLQRLISCANNAFDDGRWESAFRMYGELMTKMFRKELMPPAEGMQEPLRGVGVLVTPPTETLDEWRQLCEGQLSSGPTTSGPG